MDIDDWANMSSEDLNDDSPWLNRGSVIIALAVTFQVITWIAIFFRIYARIKPTRCLAWDDLFVVLAAITTLVGTVGVVYQAHSGLGQHIWVVLREHNGSMSDYAFWTYFVLPFYTAALTFIKISIILQYLRMADKRTYPIFRTVCWTTIVISALWGAAYCGIMIFGCSPIKGFWTSVDAKCVLFGSRNPREKVNGYITHSATNMVLDAFIFCLPLHFLYTMDLSRKTVYGIVGIFSIGACVITVAIVRFVNLVKHRLGLQTDGDNIAAFDVTFHAVPVVIFSCLEVMVATVAASIPIFWPVIVSWKSSAILVINEITVKSEKRSDLDLRSVDSAQALRDDWHYEGSNDYKMKDIETIDMIRPAVTRNDSMSRQLVFPGRGTPDPGNHERLYVTETTAQRGSVRYSQVTSSPARSVSRYDK